MSASTKKGGGTLGVNVKTENNGSSSGGNGGGSGGVGGKGDLISTTPSKSSKHGVTKNKGGGGNANTPNSKSNSVGGGIGGLGNDGTVNTAILNQQALEALYSATYVEDFIDCNDNMGDDLIRQTTRMFEMGSNYMTYIRELESAMAILLGDDDADMIIPDQLGAEKKKAVFRLQQVLMTAQDTGDDSLQVMQSIQDHIENKTRQLDVDRKNLAEYCKEQDTPETPFKDPPPPPTERNIKRARRNRHEIYRPSILGPSSLKATTYPENNVPHNTRRDHDNTHTTPSGRSRAERNTGGGGGDRADRSTSRGEAIANNTANNVDPQIQSSSSAATTTTTPSSVVANSQGESSTTAPAAGTAAAGTTPSRPESTLADLAAAAGAASAEQNAAGSSSNDEQQQPSQAQQSQGKTNGRTSERARGGGGGDGVSHHGQTTRSSTNAAANAADKDSRDHGHHHHSSRGESERRSSGAGYSSSSKKQSQKSQAQEKKTKKRKAKQSSSNSNRKEDDSPQTYAIDPDEPTYCLCDQISYGEMIGCDNDLCPIEWFHFSCVSLSTKPKGRWYCPKCRGDKPNVMKPKNIFLKELEKYNREKEEKA